MTVAARTFLDSRTEAFGTDVVTCIDSHVPVVGAFLLGSGAAGGLQPGVSDVDLVVVVEHALATERAVLVERLAALEPPVRDLELVVYVEGNQPPAFELAHGEWITKKEAKE